MPILKNLIFLIMMVTPALAWGAELFYVLDVSIDTTMKRLSGTAHLSSGHAREVRLAINNLSNITVDGKQVPATSNGMITVGVGNGRSTVVRYDAVFDGSPAGQSIGQPIGQPIGMIDATHVFLMADWFPVPEGLARYTLSVTLPREFKAVSEAESVSVAYAETQATHLFQFEHPLDGLHLAASTNFEVRQDKYNDIVIESYFFKEDAALADTYIAHTKKYLELYESILTPYPYKRFAIVENILPTGYSMPTFTLLGRAVVKLPFIVKTSLAHEILHQWFGNYVYIDHAHGNWAEGLTTYLSDYLLEEKQGRGRAYRKQVMVDFEAYVNAGNAVPVSHFQYRSSKALSTIGYGRTAMFFHGLRKRFGDETFFNAMIDFIHDNRLQTASWHDIQQSFENNSGDKLDDYFDTWLNRADIPRLTVAEGMLEVQDGIPVLKFTLQQREEPFPLDIPIQVHTESCIKTLSVRMDSQEQAFTLELDSLPTKVILDENYDLMRHLVQAEKPPVLAGIMGLEKLTVVVEKKLQPIYGPLIKALGVRKIDMATPGDISFSALKENSLVICGYDNPVAKTLLGGPIPPGTGLGLKVFKHPYSEDGLILLIHARDMQETLAVQRKLRHYGKYSELTFDQGIIITKKRVETGNGMRILEYPAPLALRPGHDPTLGQTMDVLLKSRVIFVGEKHDRYAHHMHQLEIIRHLFASGAEVAVGMEMFHQPYQIAVDDYLAGRIDEREFLKQSRYYEEWRYDYGLYKPIVDFLKTNDIPLVALNIPGDISKQVARKGLESLSDAQKARLPAELDFSNEAYQNDLKAVFSLHGDKTGIDEFNYFLQAQVLWDESMADRAFRFLENNPGRKLVILAGNGHIRHGYGVPQRLFRRSGEPYTVIVQDEALEEDIADYVLLTTEIKGNPAPKLGVMVEEKDSALTIAGISKNGPAEKAGLNQGDIIQAFDGQTIAALADLKIALYFCRKDQTTTIRILRDDQTLDKDITLFEFNSFSMHGKK